MLARHECPAITARRARRAEQLGVADDGPIVWDEAVGANVRDVDGNVFEDMAIAEIEVLGNPAGLGATPTTPDTVTGDTTDTTGTTEGG